MNEYFLDQTPIDDWFYDINIPQLESMKQYIITDYGIFDDGKVYTKEFQTLIDLIYQKGGGVMIIPKGTYISGSLNFRQGVNLYLNEDAILKGSDDILDYEIKETRVEGETCKYYNALINVDNVDGFVLFGKGTIDGNGKKYWQAFWQRLKWNPKCKNKDEQRPRLLYISNSKNVIIADATFQNSPFWTTHIYKCQYVKYLNCRFFSPHEPIKAPSTDAIDIDVCSDVLVKNCYLEVNDDAVALKGGKGPYAHVSPENGSNERIIIEDCEFGFCHSCLTCGSESIHNKNIILRRINVKDAKNILWLKMRPDTKQHYENIMVDYIKGNVVTFLYIKPWTQFFDLKGCTDDLTSKAHDILMSNCRLNCQCYFNVTKSEQYDLYDFKLSNLDINTKLFGSNYDAIKNIEINNVNIKME